MKTIILIICLILISMTGFLYNKVSSLTDGIGFLKSRNINLKNRNNRLVKSNKKLTQTNKKIAKSNSQLTEKNKTIATNNKNLVNERKRFKSKIIARNRNINKRLIIRAGQKLAKAPTAMVPFAGTAVVVAITSYEIKEICDDIKEVKTFQSELFSEDIYTQDEDIICGMDIENELKPFATEKLNNAKEWTGDNYNKIMDSSIKALNDLYENLDDTILIFNMEKDNSL